MIHDLQRVGGEGIFLLVLQGREDDLVNVVGNFGRRAANKFNE
jgi:hypothetical protein